MISIVRKYKAAIQPMHGWNVELKCSGCNYEGKPRYEGWTSRRDVNRDALATIYAKLACPKCGRRLTDEAGWKLVDLFSDVSIPEKNEKIIKQFIAGLIIVPFALAFMLLLGAQMDWWGYSAFVFLVISAVFIQPLIMLMNYRIARLRSHCECGKPFYIFMGMLERTYCYRCSSCGRLLRLRD